jgi:hypothetical protein
MNWRQLFDSLGRRSVFAAALVGATAPSFAATIGVSADTWVREDNAGSIRNGDAFMNARTASAGSNDVILLRFDLSTMTGPASGVSLDVTWQRNDSTSTRSLSLWGINDGAAGDVAWNETTVNYNNAPGMTPDGLTVATEITNGNTDIDIHDLNAAQVTPLISNQGYGPQVEAATYSFSGAALDAYLNADSNGMVTFLITRDTNTSGNQARIMTKEAATFSSGAAVPPGGAGARLTGITTIPEPTTAAIALLGLVGLLRRRS